MDSFLDNLQSIFDSEMPSLENLAKVLEETDKSKLQELYKFADNVRREYCGDGILVRGIVEFTSFCKNTCLYCGINKYNKTIERYRLTKPQILEGATQIYQSGIKTIVLQGGEDTEILPDFIADVVREIKEKLGLSITLSIGEQEDEVYKLWKDAGADRYLLKIETSNEKLYEKFHPEMSYKNRVRCLESLQSLGYQTGSGTLVGLSGQTSEILAEDLIFYKKNNFDMLGIGLFIPHKQTKLADARQGSIETTLKMLALTRIVTKNTHLPATTATASIGEYDHRIDALNSGANVIMPNFTPTDFKKLYEIYPGKKCVSESDISPLGSVELLAEKCGRFVNLSHGHSLKRK